MSTTVYLLRHTEYDNPRHILPGRLPVELSAKGVTQAEKLRDYFADKNIAKIFSSAILRCKQTSEIISNGKIPIEYDRRLLEVLCAYQGYWVENTDLYYTMRPTLGGELNIDVQKRMIDFWGQINFEEKKNYLISSHGDPIYFLYQYFCNFELKKEEDLGDLPDYPPMGSFYVLEKKGGKWKVKGLVKQENI